MRQKANRKRKPTESIQSLVEELDSHYGPCVSSSSVRRSRSVDSIAAKILDYASSSDSDTEYMPVDGAWMGDSDSEAESIDSDQEDLLKHAGVYTAEEVAVITRDKMIRLQSLYIDQFKRLQHVLKEKRREYLHSVRDDRQQYGSISSCQEDPEQKAMYGKLQAMKRYHRRFGTEALLHRLNKERRLQVSEGTNYMPPSYAKCIHTSSGLKCGERTVPLSKYCMQHILHDRHQVLFQACSFQSGLCEQPVPVLKGEQSVCHNHAPLEACRSDVLAHFKKENDEKPAQMKSDLQREKLSTNEESSTSIEENIATDHDNIRKPTSSSEVGLSTLSSNG